MIATIARAIPSLTLALGAALAAPPSVLAHGQSEPGPNGGEIRMPGAFHVEAVPGDDALLVYLLDMKFRNPKVTGSSVEVRVTRNAESWWLECRAVQAEKRFRCTLPTGANLATGELMVSASRGNLPEASAQYELPLMQGDSAGA